MPKKSAGTDAAHEGGIVPFIELTEKEPPFVGERLDSAELEPLDDGMTSPSRRVDSEEKTATDKKTLSEEVSKLTWKYALKADTVQVLPYEDAEREYLEIAVVEAMLSGRKRAPRIAEMIQRAF